MKSRKIFYTSLAKAYVFYTVFESCSVFSVLKDGKLLPVYDFSGNGIRSTLNSLRNEGLNNPRFRFRIPVFDGSTFATSYFSDSIFCYVYF